MYIQEILNVTADEEILDVMFISEQDYVVVTTKRVLRLR
jgi:hypothetical protein